MAQTLKAEGVTFKYDGGKHSILENVSIEIGAGERVGISEPSGFGKTTLCKLLAGYEQPAAGTITLDGRPLSEFKGPCPVQLIWQHPELAVNPRLKMRSVLEEGPGADRRILHGLGIDSAWLERYPGELSGGELQRFCIARALGEHTKYLIADEISAMLDLVSRSLIWEFLLEEVTRRNIGLLVISHSESLLKLTCGRMLHLS